MPITGLECARVVTTGFGSSGNADPLSPGRTVPSLGDPVETAFSAFWLLLRVQSQEFTEYLFSTQ